MKYNGKDNWHNEMYKKQNETCKKDNEKDNKVINKVKSIMH